MKTVLITGGTSGIGFALVKQYASEGWIIYATGTHHLEGYDPLVRLFFWFAKVNFVEWGFGKKFESCVKFDLVIHSAFVMPHKVDDTSFQLNKEGFDEILLKAKSDNAIFVFITSGIANTSESDIEGIPLMKPYWLAKNYCQNQVDDYSKAGGYAISINPGLVNTESLKKMKAFNIDYPLEQIVRIFNAQVKGEISSSKKVARNIFDFVEHFNEIKNNSVVKLFKSKPLRAIKKSIALRVATVIYFNFWQLLVILMYLTFFIGAVVLAIIYEKF